MYPNFLSMSIQVSAKIFVMFLRGTIFCMLSWIINIIVILCYCYFLHTTLVFLLHEDVLKGFLCEKQDLEYFSWKLLLA